MIRRATTCSLLMTMAVLLAATSSAQPLRWEPAGPYSVPIDGLTRDSSRSLIAFGRTLRGIYKSTDDGVTWSAIAKFPAEQFAVGPANEFYALDFITHRVMRSLDRGQAWYDMEARTDSADAWIHTLAASPDGTVYVGTAWSGRPPRSARTTNGGITWVMSVLPDDEPIAIAGFNALGDLFKIVPEDRGRLRRSTDNGNSWSDVPGIDTVTSSVLLAPDGSLYVLARHRLYRSTNDGYSWTERGPWTQGRPTRLSAGEDGALFASGDGISPAAVLRSVDDGATWEPLPGAGKSVVGVLGTRSAVLVGDANGGVHRSTDGGITFVQASHGLRGESCSTVAVFAGDVVVMRTMRGANRRLRTGTSQWDSTALDARMVRDRFGTIYALSAGRIGRSSDAGVTWQYTDSVLPTTAQRLAVGVRGFFAAVVDGNIWRSLDSGKTWEVLDTSFRPNVKGIGFDTSGTVVLSAESTGMWRYYEATGKFGTVPGGTAQAGAINSFVTKETGEIFVATMDRGLRRSTDDGRTFVDVAAELPTRDILRLQVNALGHLVIATQSGVYLSRNNGDSWESHGPGQTLIRDLALDGAGHAWIATDEGMFVSAESTSGAEEPTIHPATSALSISPNPAESVVRLHAGAWLSSGARLEFFDALGTLVKDVSIGPGGAVSGGLPIPLDDLVSGIYRVRLIAGKHTFTAQLVVAR